MRALAHIPFETVQQGRDIDASPEGEIFPTDFSVACRIAEINLLAADCAGSFDLDRYVVLCNPHGEFPPE